MAENPQNSYKLSSPLLSCVPQTALDAVYGAAALVDAQQNLNVLSRNWNEFMARSGRSDLAKNSVLGSSLLSFFRDEQQKQVFRNLLDSMANDELGTHNQVVDLGSKESPFYVQFHVHPLWKDGVLIGYLLHCLDTTKEHANRLTLIDHDRQLHQLRELKENYESELNAAKELIGSAAKEQEDKDKALKQFQEKASRKEKALKAAIKQAELSANSMASKDRELETLREEKTKLDTELTEAREQIDKYADELGTREEELGKLADQIDDLQKERDEALKKLSSVDSKDEEAETKLRELEQEKSSLEEKLLAAEKEHQRILSDYETQSEQLNELRESYRELSQSVELISQESDELKTKSEDELNGLKSENLRRQSILDGLALPICWMSPKGVIESCNHAFRDYFELENESNEIASLADLFSEDDIEQIESLLEDPYSNDNIVLHLVNGNSDRPFHLTPQFDDGRFIGCVGACNPDTHSRTEEAATDIAESDSIYNVRLISADLAESFGDLLTAVVGHASLAAAEVDSDSPSLSDIRAIEESAGEAAKLVRQLHALSGKSRSNTVTDFNSSVERFLRKQYESDTEGSQVQIELPESKIKIPADHATVEIILKGIASHVDLSADPESAPLWKMTEEDDLVKLSVSYQGELIVPNGWFDNGFPSKDMQGYGLCFAREAARAFGGRLEIHDLNSAQELVLWLPLAAVRTEA